MTEHPSLEQPKKKEEIIDLTPKMDEVLAVQEDRRVLLAEMNQKLNKINEQNSELDELEKQVLLLLKKRLEKM